MGRSRRPPHLQAGAVDQTSARVGPMRVTTAAMWSGSNHIAAVNNLPTTPRGRRVGIRLAYGYSEPQGSPNVALPGRHCGAHDVAPGIRLAAVRNLNLAVIPQDAEIGCVVVVVRFVVD